MYVVVLFELIISSYLAHQFMSEAMSLQLNPSAFFGLLCILWIELLWLLMCVWYMHVDCITLSGNPGKNL